MQEISDFLRALLFHLIQLVQPKTLGVDSPLKLPSSLTNHSFLPILHLLFGYVDLSTSGLGLKKSSAFPIHTITSVGCTTPRPLHLYYRTPTPQRVLRSGLKYL